MKHYIPYFIAYIVFVASLIAAGQVYSHFHFDAIPLVEMYQADKEKWEQTHTSEEYFMTHDEWLANEEKRSKDFWQECSYQIAESFDPWFERPNPDDKTEKGRD